MIVTDSSKKSTLYPYKYSKSFSSITLSPHIFMIGPTPTLSATLLLAVPRFKKETIDHWLVFLRLILGIFPRIPVVLETFGDDAKSRVLIAIEQAGCRVVRHPSGLEISNNAADRAMLGHGHQRGQGDALSAAFGDKPRAQAVPAEIAFQAGQRRPALHDRRHCRR